MNKEIVLNHDDLKSLVALLQYLEHEEHDFIERATEYESHNGEHLILFNEHGVLLLDEVPETLRSHVYYQSRVLWQELAGVLESNPGEVLR